MEVAEDDSGSLISLIKKGKRDDGGGFLKCLFFKCSGKLTEDDCGFLFSQLIF